jgi:hypothetical protein
VFGFFLPLDKHYDKGFGEIADSFYDAAESLKPSSDDNLPPHAHLPICYLYRHAIELYLKGTLLIFHQHLKLAYGDNDYSSEPHVLVNGKWKPMYSTHQVADLFEYVKDLFLKHMEYLNENTLTNWTFPVNLGELIKMVDQLDTSSTYFRYPITMAGERDLDKSSFKKTTVDEVMSQALNEQRPMKSMFSIDMLGQTKAIYVHDNAMPLAMLATLSEAAQILSGMHAALVSELGHGL